MLSLSLVQYLYEHGSLSLYDLHQLVKMKEISEGDFHEITRMHYKSLKEMRKWD